MIWKFVTMLFGHSDDVDVNIILPFRLNIYFQFNTIFYSINFVRENITFFYTFNFKKYFSYRKSIFS